MDRRGRGQETRIGRRVQATTLAVLLLGSLFPTIAGTEPVLVAAVLAVPMVLFQVFAALPRVHPVVPFVTVLFGALVGTGLLNPPVTAYGAEKLTRLATLTLLSAAAAALIRSRAGLATFGRVWLGLATVLALVALVGGQEVAGRAVGFEGNNAIWLGRAMATGLVVLVWLRWTGRVRAVPAAALAGVLLGGLWVTGSRGPMLAAVLGVAVLAARPVLARTGRTLVLLFGALAGAAALAFVPALQESRLAALLFGRDQDVTADIRGELLTRGVAAAREHPGGTGYGGYMAAAGTEPVPYPHNLFLEVAVEAGWAVAALLILIVVFVAARLSRRPGDPAAALLLALLAVEVLHVSASGDLNARTFFAVLTLGFLVSTWPRLASVHDEGLPQPRLQLVDLSLQGGERRAAGIRDGGGVRGGVQEAPQGAG